MRQSRSPTIKIAPCASARAPQRLRRRSAFDPPRRGGGSMATAEQQAPQHVQGVAIQRMGLHSSPHAPRTQPCLAPPAPSSAWCEVCAGKRSARHSGCTPESFRCRLRERMVQSFCWEALCQAFSIQGSSPGWFPESCECKLCGRLFNGFCREALCQAVSSQDSAPGCIPESSECKLRGCTVQRFCREALCQAFSIQGSALG